MNSVWWHNPIQEKATPFSKSVVIKGVIQMGGRSDHHTALPSRINKRQYGETQKDMHRALLQNTKLVSQLGLADH
jgi:hypothetical protein